jgi:tetratricopeptide (TPR) repeat protein
MEISTSRQSERAELDELLRSGRFDDALVLLSSTEANRELDLAELVSKGRAIMLASAQTTYPLATAEEAFQRALDLDPHHVPALLELAWYYHSVEDDSQRALPLFEQAIELSREQLTEAARGRAGCLAEMDSEAAASASLRSVHEAALFVEGLTEEEQGWLKSRSGM